MIVQYKCRSCGKNFSFIEVLRENRQDRRYPMCPWCSSEDLLLVHRESFGYDRRKEFRVTNE